MASKKVKRKAAGAAKKATRTGPFRHADGDRRWRGVGPDAKQAIRDKKLLGLIGAVDLGEEEAEEFEDES